MDIVKKARAGAFYLGNKDKVDEIVEAYHAFGGIEGVLGVIKGYPKKELEAAKSLVNDILGIGPEVIDRFLDEPSLVNEVYAIVEIALEGVPSALALRKKVKVGEFKSKFKYAKVTGNIVSSVVPVLHEFCGRKADLVFYAEAQFNCSTIISGALKEIDEKIKELEDDRSRLKVAFQENLKELIEEITTLSLEVENIEKQAIEEGRFKRENREKYILNLDEMTGEAEFTAVSERVTIPDLNEEEQIRVREIKGAIEDREGYSDELKCQRDVQLGEKTAEIIICKEKKNRISSRRIMEGIQEFNLSKIIPEAVCCFLLKENIAQKKEKGGKAYATFNEKKIKKLKDLTGYLTITIGNKEEDVMEGIICEIKDIESDLSEEKIEQLKSEAVVVRRRRRKMKEVEEVLADADTTSRSSSRKQKKVPRSKKRGSKGRR